MKPNIGAGDSGETNILGGRRLPKDSPLVEALGAIDEAASAIGLARSFMTDDQRRGALRDAQLDLQKVAAEVAAAGAPRATDFDFAAAVARLENHMARIAASVPRPHTFLTPGNTPAEGALNLARAVTRRAERAAVALGRSGAAFEPGAQKYLNRLSDLLFDMITAEMAGR